MERDSLLMYRGTWGMLQDIRANNMDEYIEAVDMFFNYAFDGVEPDIDGASLVLRLFWKAAKPLIDANNRNYVNGCKGGAPLGNQNAKKQPKNNPKSTQKQPKTTQKQGNDNDNVNDNDNDNVHGNVNANEHDNDNENVNKKKEINKEKNPYVDVSIDGEPFITDLKKYNEWIAEHGDPEEEEGA